MLYIPFRRPLLLVLSAYLLSLALIPHAFAATTATFTPSQIPLSSPEIVNPLRGYIKWGGGSETVPVGEPAKDWTNRISWSDIEKSQGVYDWSITDQLLEKAASEGRRMSLAFRDMRDYDANPLPPLPTPEERAAAVAADPMTDAMGGAE